MNGAARRRSTVRRHGSFARVAPVALRRLREPFRIVFAEVALEEAAVALLVAKDRDDHVLRDRVDALGELDDRVVVVDRAGLGLDHALDDVDDVGLVVGRLQERLLGGELERAGHHAVELLDAVGELLRVAELLLDVLLQRLDDLLRADAVGVDRVRDVAHHGLDLHPVRLLEHLDDPLACVGVVVGQDSLGGGAKGRHVRSPWIDSEVCGDSYPDDRFAHADVPVGRRDHAIDERRPDMAGELEGKKIAILATDGVEQVELTEPRKALEDAGATTDLVSLEAGEIQGFTPLDHADKLPVDKTLDEVSPDDYDGVLVPGGVANGDFLRADEGAVSFVAGFARA